MLRKKINFKLGGSSGGSISFGARRLSKAGYLVPGIAIGLLGFLSITALCPIQTPSASAEGEMTLAATLSPSITLSMSSSVSESIEPTVDGSFKNLATVARVQVANSEYYDVSIHGNSDMVGQNNPDEKISAISGEKKASEFTANTWGYTASKNATGVTTAVVATSDTAYKPVPATSTQIVETQNTTNNAADDYYSLNFGAKVDTSIPADTYTSRVTLSVVASPVLVAQVFDGIETMQELTPAICNKAEAGDTTRLEDSRDGKYYWVAKLPDGNCWTTQNMDYEISGAGLSIGTEQGSDTGKYWENGLKVMNAPSGSATTTIDSTWTASTDVDFYTRNGNSAVDSTNKVYDAHYLTGNYYQYSVAPTVCTGMGIQWNLPTANQATTVNGSYNKLVNGQSTSSDSWILAKPYFFPRAGRINGTSGSQLNVGTDGYYWSSTPDGSYGYALNFGSSYVNPANGGHGRHHGFSVRCYVPSIYSVTYDANGGTNAPATQEAVASDDSHEFTIAGTAPTREGYTFLGWSEDSAATEATYAAGSKVALTSSKPTLTLYAVWKINVLNNVTTMQGLTAAICKSASVGDTAQLTDARTNNADTSSLNKYWVTKLPDGNCWMTQNLDYAPSTPASTSSVGTNQNDTGKIWDDGLKVMTNPTTFSTSNATTSVSGMTASTDSTMTASISGNTYNAHYLTGNYYQYSAAQTACSSIGSQWNLPTSNQGTDVNGSFNKLTDGVTQTQIVASPYFFPIAGYANPLNGSMGNVGSSGHYWSSVPYGSSGGYLLYFYSSSITPSGSSARYNGFSVRCYVNGN